MSKAHASTIPKPTNCSILKKKKTQTNPSDSISNIWACYRRTDLTFARDAVTERTYASSARFRNVFWNNPNPKQKELLPDSQEFSRTCHSYTEVN